MITSTMTRNIKLYFYNLVNRNLELLISILMLHQMTDMVTIIKMTIIIFMAQQKYLCFVFSFFSSAYEGSLSFGFMYVFGLKNY